MPEDRPDLRETLVPKSRQPSPTAMVRKEERKRADDATERYISRLEKELDDEKGDNKRKDKYIQRLLLFILFLGAASAGIVTEGKFNILGVGEIIFGSESGGQHAEGEEAEQLEGDEQRGTEGVAR